MGFCDILNLFFLHSFSLNFQEVRERIESKFIGTSPALASPVERGISSSVSSKPSREETTTNAGSVENPEEGVSAAGSSFGTPQGPVHSQPVASSNEVGFVRTNRYTRLTSRDVDDVLFANGSKANVSQMPNYSQNSNLVQQQPNVRKTSATTPGLDSSSLQYRQSSIVAKPLGPVSAYPSQVGQGIGGPTLSATSPPLNPNTNPFATTQHSLSAGFPSSAQNSNNDNSNFNPTYPQGAAKDTGMFPSDTPMAGGTALTSDVSSSSSTAAANNNTVFNITNKTNTPATNVPPVAKAFSRPYENLPMARVPSVPPGDLSSTTCSISDKNARPILSSTNEYKNTGSSGADVGVYKNYAVVNVGSDSGSSANRPSLVGSSSQVPSSTSSYHPVLQEATSLNSTKSSFRPYIPPAGSKMTSAVSGPIPSSRRKPEYVSVSVPFSANSSRSELLPSKSSSFDSGTSIHPYPSVPNPYSMYPGSNQNTRDHKGQKSSNSDYYYTKQLSPENTLSKSAVPDSGYSSTNSKIYDVFEPRSYSSFDQPKTSSSGTRPKTYSDASGLRQTLVIPSSSKTYSGNTGVPSMDYSSQSSRPKDSHLHHPSAPLGRSPYSRYTPMSSEKAPNSSIVYSGLSSDPYLKSYSDRSLDTYFKEGMSKYNPVGSSMLDQYPKYAGVNSSLSGVGSSGGQYQFTTPVISSRPLSMDTSSGPGGRMSGYRSPPLDSSAAGLSRSASLKDRHVSGPGHSTGGHSHYKY